MARLHAAPMYMVTLTTEGRRKLFGEVVGRSEALPGAEDAPRMVLSAFGKRVEEEFLGVYVVRVNGYSKTVVARQ